jgi:signal transduction histidine kinase
VLRAAESSRRLSLQGRVFVITLAGSLTGVASIFVVAQLMFVSTSHDLAVLAAVLAFVAFVSTVFGAFVASSLSSRVGVIAGAIQRLRTGDYSPALPPEAGDELGALAGDVEALARQLRRADEERAALERERRDLTVAISHDLRTPLASLRAMVEALADGVVQGESEARRYYDAMRREVERLGALIDDLFELARIDAGALQLEMSPLPIEEIAADVVAGMEPQARGLSIELALDAQPALPKALVDGRRIERAISNLVRNALQHTPRGGRVEVSLRQDGAWIVVSVSDTGRGIEEQQLPRVWERFYRAEASRARDADGDGAGLGLAIVRGFVEAHGGRVEAESRPRLGSTFTIRLPVPAS